jgi:hypothetical protein
MVAPLCVTCDSVTIGRDSACFTVIQNDSSRKVTEKRADCKETDSVPLLEIHPQVGPSVDACYAAPTTSGEALHLAIKLAVDAGEYEQAAALLDVARSTTAEAGPQEMTARRSAVGLHVKARPG